MLRLRPSPARVAHQMDDEIAAADKVRQVLQQSEAALLKILLDLDRKRLSPGCRQVNGPAYGIRFFGAE